MKNLLIFAVSISFLSCTKTEIEYSTTLHEDGSVSSLVYTPSAHRNECSLTAIKTGALGMDYRGNFGVRVGDNLQINNVTVPEKFSVVFQCTHGKFIING